MKNFIHSTATWALTALFFLICTNAFSQVTTTWKGGTPGMENDWNCAKNWSNYKVPDAFSNVIIPDVSTTTQATPLIRQGRAEVNTLYLDSNANLTIDESAQLVIHESEGSFIPDNIRCKDLLWFLNESEGHSTKQSTASLK
ncbi:MAG: hypothetical protein GC192_17720 [Bacteroidetes bacterium]|nr:hypothetical protein [Bacteroidota bacterium]